MVGAGRKHRPCGARSTTFCELSALLLIAAGVRKMSTAAACVRGRAGSRGAARQKFLARTRQSWRCCGRQSVSAVLLGSQTHQNPAVWADSWAVSLTHRLSLVHEGFYLLSLNLVSLCSASWAQIGRDVHAEQAKAIAIVTAAFFVVNRLSNFFFRITGLVKDDYRRNMLGSCVGSVVHCVAVSIATYEELNSRGWTLFGFYTGANGSGFSHVLSHYARSSTHSTAQVECACRVRVRTDGAGVAAAGRSSTWARRIRQRGLLLSSFALDTCSLTR